MKLLSRGLPFHKRPYIEQESLDFDPRLLTLKIQGVVYLDGLWQSESYFKDIEDTIRQTISAQAPPPTQRTNGWPS